MAWNCPLQYLLYTFQQYNFSTNLGIAMGGNASSFIAYLYLPGVIIVYGWETLGKKVDI